MAPSAPCNLFKQTCLASCIGVAPSAPCSPSQRSMAPSTPCSLFPRSGSRPGSKPLNRPQT
eukprot:scaffold143026_cov14-Tisochrysis_lutea.AAC.1